jgi:S1-C subfamily serine protease
MKLNFLHVRFNARQPLIYGLMNLKDFWKYHHKSVCSITFLEKGNRISSGTGFKVGDRLITNNHVIQVPPADAVEIRFIEEDGYSSLTSKTLTIPAFRSMMLEGMPEDSWDYATFDIGRLKEFIEIPSLDLAEERNIAIGEQIAVLGFQFEQTSLSMHIGHVSSKYIRAGVKYLQLDCSVNNGNSGGPLISLETGEVIGIVTRKHTGLTMQFDTLIEITKKQIADSEAYLSPNNPRKDIVGHNTHVAMYNSLTKLLAITQEMKRSANVGIGFAYQLDMIRNSL